MGVGYHVGKTGRWCDGGPAPRGRDVVVTDAGRMRWLGKPFGDRETYATSSQVLTDHTFRGRTPSATPS